MTVKTEFQGMSSHRYDREPLEKCFALEWQKLNDTSVPGKAKSTLAYLMDKNNRGEPDPQLTDRDWLVANTVIQWIGSPVGQFFLSEVITAEDAKPFLEKLVSILEEKDKKDSEPSQEP